MSEIAIRVEGLSKLYRIGARRERHNTLRDRLASTAAGSYRAARSLFSGNGRTASAEESIFWALRDVSFEVKHGEVIGVIGRNGAGKSTLLKILSRITQPTEGRAVIQGRLGSLLEVGTGFHSELSGRDNVYLNGAILGMRHEEVDAKFDEIVAFADVEKFIDTPVKHYSSGMHMRLAFSVAAHLETDVLLIDEVLAVGDSSFQKKCLGKMGEVARGGRTVLFVSHNSAAIEALCDRCIWLKDGRLAGQGEPSALLSQYLTADGLNDEASVLLSDHKGRRSGSQTIMRELTLLSNHRVPLRKIHMGESIGVQVSFVSDRPLRPVLGVVIKTTMGANLFGVNNRAVPSPEVPQSVKNGVITCWIEKPPLMPGIYFVDLYFGSEYEDHDVVLEAATLEVEASNVFGTGRLVPPSAGPICWPGRYEFSQAPVPAAQTVD